MITVNDTMKEFTEITRSTPCGNEYKNIISLMLITELKKINENINLLIFKIKNEEAWE